MDEEQENTNAKDLVEKLRDLYQRAAVQEVEPGLMAGVTAYSMQAFNSHEEHTFTLKVGRRFRAKITISTTY